MAEKASEQLILADGVIKTELNELFGRGYTVISENELSSSNAANIVAFIPIVSGATRSFEASVEMFPNLRVVCSNGTGYEHINVALARSKGIQVGYYPHAFAVETAEFALTLLLAVSRKLMQAVAIKRNLKECMSRIDDCIQKCISVPIAGSKLGIVGMGSVGFEIAKRARGFDMSVLYHNRNRRADELEVGAVYYSDLNAMLPECDFLVLAVRVSSDTQHMIGKEQLDKMKRSCVVINIARASVIDQEALITALKEQRLGGAGLDVTDSYVLPENHPLLSMDNVLVTPHIAWAGERGIRDNNQVLVDNIKAGIEGKPLSYPVK